MKILIVDDEHVEIQALEYILSRSDLPLEAILTAGNGRQAIEAAKKHAPDMVLMDIKMPGISGTEAAAVIKDMLPDCRIVFLSAYNYFDYAQEAIRLKASDFLIKPVSDHELISLVSRLIGEFRLENRSREINSNIESQFRQISSFFENELINYILFADVKKQQLTEYFQALGCHPDRVHAITVTMDDRALEAQSSLKANMIKGRCLKTIKEEFSAYTDHCYGNFQKNWLYLLAIVPEGIAADTAAQLLNSIQQVIRHKLSINCRLSISSSTLDLMQLNGLILANKEALLFNTEKNVIVFPKNQSAGHTRNFSPKKEQLLLESIRLNNPAMIISLSTEFSRWLTDCGLSVTKMKFRLIGLLTYLSKSIKDSNPALDAPLEAIVDHYMQRIETVDNPDTLTSCFTDQLMGMAHLLTKDIMNPDSPVILRICRYIDDNYMLDLSLGSMAEELNMNGQYLSKLFRTEKGITFSDYLTDVRISTAKKLLVDTNDSIQEIGFTVGYKDPNYFTRAFKKHEALTPKQYRVKASAL